MNSPFDAEWLSWQEVKVREEKERVDGEIELPPSIYTPPPHPDAEQDVKVRDVRERIWEDERVTEIAPPFSDEQDVNVTPVIVWSPENEVNSNTPPFPLSRLIDLKVFDSITVRHPALTEMSGWSYVA